MHDEAYSFSKFMLDPHASDKTAVSLAMEGVDARPAQEALQFPVRLATK